MQLRQFQYTEANVEGLVEERLDFPHLDPHQTLGEDFQAHAVWLFEEFLAICSLVMSLMSVSFFSFSQGFPYIELFSRLKNSFSKSFLTAARNVEFFWIYGASLLKAKEPVNITQPHAVLGIESKVEIVHLVFALRQQVWNH